MWEPDFETIPRSELKKLQLERLKQKVKDVYEKVPLYRTRFNEAGVSPEAIKSLEDISRLPFTSKADFRDGYPYDLLAVPLSEVVRVHASSGTTGKPIVAPYTTGDIETWATLMARTLTSAVMKATFVLKMPTVTGCLPGAWAFTTAARRSVLWLFQPHPAIPSASLCLFKTWEPP